MRRTRFGGWVLCRLIRAADYCPPPIGRLQLAAYYWPCTIALCVCPSAAIVARRPGARRVLSSELCARMGGRRSARRSFRDVGERRRGGRAPSEDTTRHCCGRGPPSAGSLGLAADRWPTTGRVLLTACYWPPLASTTDRRQQAGRLLPGACDCPFTASRLQLAAYYWPPTTATLLRRTIGRPLLAASEYPADSLGDMSWRSTRGPAKVGPKSEAGVGRKLGARDVAPSERPLRPPKDVASRRNQNGFGAPDVGCGHEPAAGKGRNQS